MEASMGLPSEHTLRWEDFDGMPLHGAHPGASDGTPIGDLPGWLQWEPHWSPPAVVAAPLGAPSEPAVVVFDGSPIGATHRSAYSGPSHLLPMPFAARQCNSCRLYRESDLVKLDIQINGEPVEPLATIVHKDKAYSVGRALTQKLKELIPRQMFKVPIQACIGTKVIASEALSAIRKDVLAKCYGGDISRKKKLLKKQAEGKRRMKAIGRVEVPQEAFMAVLRLEKEVL
ncbi:hypothetical protein Taro_028254 [Colocasia esculenta]|uniref:GTP-binding protein LepA C-terminal domain-containing protein n=1 Tax=Colocasia esculenta TaxID=4460 RepID=A0A843VRB1_COLES|nr:hypothetical protein [Colocasia esculenta]